MMAAAAAAALADPPATATEEKVGAAGVGGIEVGVGEEQQFKLVTGVAPLVGGDDLRGDCVSVSSEEEGGSASLLEGKADRG